MPITKCLIELAKINNLDVLRQIGKCYTLATLSSMLTGELTCDLLEGGIGWNTWETYRNSNTEELKLPWLSRMLPEIFRRAGWKIHIHNPDRYNKNIDTDSGNIYTNIPQSYGHFSLTCDEERKFIQEQQNDKPKQNTMYFFYYEHFHESILSHRDSKEAEECVYELISFWDFSEPDAIFWIFSDHGNWIEFGEQKYPTPINYLTWVLFRDNIKPYIDVKSKFMSVRDFYATMVNKFKLDKAPLISDIYSIQEPQNRDRIYYVEDARSIIDIYHSTTAIACKFVDWEKGEPTGILQVVYYKPDDEFIGMYTFLDSSNFRYKTIKTRKVDNILKQAILNRIKWINK